MTEDDTFLALKRIPLSEIVDRYFDTAGVYRNPYLSSNEVNEIWKQLWENTSWNWNILAKECRKNNIDLSTGE
jgi:hypothetical protein